MLAESVTQSLQSAAYACLSASDPSEKLQLTQQTALACAAGNLLQDDLSVLEAISAPGRPDRPVLVLPRDVQQRGLGSKEGRAAFIHAIAHIEFNAINLAWDAVYRFRSMPAAFYTDWASVAADEARHFALLSARLQRLGAAYGDYSAHNGLWEMAEKTADSCLARMALVPRVLEARGLDVTPVMIEKLRGLGDHDSVEILELILREEIRHVAIGSYWFAWCCEREGKEPVATFMELIKTVVNGALRGPFNLAARTAAGFSDNEMAQLTAFSQAQNDARKSRA